MSAFSRAVKEKRHIEKTGAEVNYMGGISYRIDPLDTLKMVTASSIFGEPQYYRDGEFAKASLNDGVFRLGALGQYLYIFRHAGRPRRALRHR